MLHRVMAGSRLCLFAQRAPVFTRNKSALLRSSHPAISSNILMPFGSGSLSNPWAARMPTPPSRRFSSKTDDTPVPEPTKRQLWIHGINSAVPMIGFGLMDNLVMIQAGDLIDSTFGVAFGLTTLTAAACGQIVSDFTGVCFGGTVEALASKLGLPKSGMTEAQMNTKRSRFYSTSFAAIGVVIGCLLGMLSLLFMDLDKNERLRKQAELATLFNSLMEHPHELLGVEYCTLWMLDDDGNTMWSKVRRGALPSDAQLEATFKSYDTDNSGEISAKELRTALRKLGFTMNLLEVRRLVSKYDENENGELDLNEFKQLMKEVVLSEDILTKLSENHLLRDTVQSKKALVIEDAHGDARFDKNVDTYTGYRTQSMLFVPIMHPDTDRVLGVIELVNKDANTTGVSIGQFDENDIRICRVLAAHAALFIKNCE